VFADLRVRFVIYWLDDAIVESRAALPRRACALESCAGQKPRQGSLLVMSPGLEWILVYDDGSYCCTAKSVSQSAVSGRDSGVGVGVGVGKAVALNGKRAKQRVATNFASVTFLSNARDVEKFHDGTPPSNSMQGNRARQRIRVR